MTSAFSVPLKHRDAVNGEIVCPSHGFELVCAGRSMSKLRWQMLCGASSNIITVTSVCSSKESVDKMVLYGSTIAVSTCGQADTVKLDFDDETCYGHLQVNNIVGLYVRLLVYVEVFVEDGILVTGVKIHVKHEN